MKDKSYNQVKYYWGVMMPMIGYFKGWSNARAHQWVKETWNIETTSTMTTIAYEELMNWVRVHTNTRWGLVIPLPNEDLEREASNLPPEALFEKYNPNLQKN